MKRKIAWIIYGLFVTVCFLTTKQTADAKGYIRYNLSEDGVLSFYGKGELKRADYLLSIEKDCYWGGNYVIGKKLVHIFSKCQKSDSSLIFKKIGDNVFSYMSAMETIKVPNSVISIGKGAFSDCDLLKKLVLPASLKSWKKGIAQDCPSLSTIINRSKVTCHLDNCRG